MSEKLKGEKVFSLRKYVLLAIGLTLVVRTIWRLPRTNWSLKDVGRTRFAAKEVSPTSLPREEIRHVVLISIDTCRADHLGCYGYSRKTSPNIDAIAADGVIFNHAVTPVPLTLPSHSSMLTGTIPLYHKVRDNNNYRLDSSNITLAEILKDNGFVTGAFISAFVLDSQFGLDQGFDTYNDSLAKEDKESSLINERKAKETTDLVNVWLEKHRNDNFFLFLHYFDPHFPYQLHKRFAFTSLPFFALTKDLYDSEIAYTDFYIGQVIKKLKALNLYDSTLLIVTADHGESLGEHSEESHGYFIYHGTMHVPLIVKAPGWPKGERIGDVVGLIDIVPTVCSSVGIAVPKHVQGKDLNTFFPGKSGFADQRYLFCESLTPTKFGLGPFLGLVSNRWKYIHTSKPDLYDLIKDPYENENLLNQQREQARIMKGQLEQILQTAGISSIAGNKASLDEQTRSRLESLGYISSRTVDENIQLDKERLDPKKFIEVYNFIEKFMGFKLTKKFDKAKKLCNDMLTKWPDVKQIHYYLGLIAVAEKDMEAISTYFSRYVAEADSDPNGSGMRLKATYELAIAYANLGAASRYKGQIEQATAYYKKSLFYHPYTAAVNCDLADAYLLQDKLDDAIKYYTKTLELDPRFPEAHYKLGNILLKQGKLEKAIAHYNKAITLRPNWREPRENLQAALARKSQIGGNQ